MTEIYSLPVKIPSTGLNMGLQKLCNRPQVNNCTAMSQHRKIHVISCCDEYVYNHKENYLVWWK